MALPSLLPRNIRLQAMQPPGLEDDELWAWSQPDARVALASLVGTIVAVYQVDVYVAPFGQEAVVFSGRQAIYCHQPGETALQFAARSRHAADEFVRDGARDELFVFYFSDQDDADSGFGMAKRA